jgi:hypothetical protein
VADDRVDEAGHSDAVKQVADEAAAANHRAGRDRRGRVCEGELEDPERQQRHAGAAVRRRQVLQEEPMRTDEPMCTTAVFEHEGEADRPEEDATDTCVRDAFHKNVDRLPLTREAGLQHHEAYLHGEDEKRRNQRPGRIHGVDRRNEVS